VSSSCSGHIKSRFPNGSFDLGDVPLLLGAYQFQVLQHTAVRCQTLPTPCNTQQHPASLCNTLEDTATHCATLRHAVTHYNTRITRLQFESCARLSSLASVLQCVAVCCIVLQCVAVCCSVLQCVAVCCSVLQCVAVCCSVLQCVAVC